eukprot:CAMPEP_0172165506 /NCGR_PEP_ID=MMETSP1050-20130122/8451_1 /TAXON_ID=233186 /ORGANISM="Cryptomonas curvata, Strain CCAP979/52" /LENGTH=191 /DNA_ID=CAMNT_0012835987 /DNA_START=112 /DNA_END=687 /DNA_ORIENTATION=-
MTASGAASVRILAGMARTCRMTVNSMSGTMEFQMVKKLYGAFCDLFSGFLELGALAVSLTLLFWVSGLFFGLAVCSVFIVAACLYVLACAIGMNWVLDCVRIYLRDCLLLRVCSFAIPVVSVLRGVKFTTGVTVHFPEHSMIWILHAGNWVIRLCWRNCFEPWYLFSGASKSTEKIKPKTESEAARAGHAT